MRLNYYLSLFLVCLLAVTCTKDETTPRQYPRVQTGDATDITSRGATFRATITFSSGTIIDRGFIWSDSPGPTINDSDIIALGGISGSGSYDARVERDLASNKQYYVRAYVKTEAYMVFGNTTSFLSLGSLAPQVTSFSPTIGSIGDTVVIRGKNFSIKRGVTLVNFNSTSASVIYVSDSILKTKVPDALTDLSSQLSISVYGNKGVSSAPFKLTPPEILAVDKNPIGLCDTLVISTAHLPNDLANIKVFFNSTSVLPISFSEGKLKVKVPFLSPTTTSIALKLVYGVQQNVYPTALSFLQPKLNGVSPSSVGFLDTVKMSMVNIPACNISAKIDGTSTPFVELTPNYFKIIIPKTITSYNPVIKVYSDNNLLFQSQLSRVVSIESISPTTGVFDDLIIINGHGFHPDASQNTVTFAGIVVPIISSTTRQIKIKVPENLNVNSTGIAGIRVSSVYIDAAATQSFIVKAPVISSISPSIITNNSTVIVTGSNFNPNLSYNSLKVDNIGSPLDLVSATSTTLVFSANNSSLTNDRNYSTNYSSALTLNVSGQTITSSSTVVSYVGPWNQKADPPNPTRRYPVSFSIGNKLYYGLGWDFLSGTYFKDFWEYDTSSDTWTQLNDFPGGARLNAANFAVNGFGYVGMGLNGLTVYTDIWKFDPMSKSWTRLSDFPGNPASGVFPGNEDFSGASVMNGQVYAGFGVSQFWKYDPINDSWSQLKDTPFYMAKTMNSKNFIYAIVGTGNGNHYPLNRYDISTDTWAPCSYLTDGVTYYFSALGNLYSGFYGYPQYINKYDDLQNSVISIASPFNWFYCSFESNGLIYFIDQNKRLMSLDPGLYPLKP